MRELSTEETLAEARKDVLLWLRSESSKWKPHPWSQPGVGSYFKVYVPERIRLLEIAIKAIEEEA